MKIMEFLNRKAMTIDLKATDKEGVIRELVDLLAKSGEIKNKEAMLTNKNFTVRAPEEIVAEEKNKLIALHGQLKKLEVIMSNPLMVL